MTERRLAVTGASGFVGRRVVAAAARAGWETLGFVRSREEPVAAAGGRPVRCGLDAAALARHLEGCAAIVHLANVGSEREQEFETVNVEGTRALVAAAQRAGVPRVVYFSGLGVAHYGQARHTTNRYFLSKLAAEFELLRSGLEVAIFRPSYVLGPGSDLVRVLAAELKAGEIEVIGDGAYRLQPIAVTDAAEAALAAARRAESWPLVFDLVGPEPLSYAQLAERVARILGVSQYSVRSVARSAAEGAAAASGYRGMTPEELDCLLCDEVASAGPLEELLERALLGLDETLSGVAA